MQYFYYIANSCNNSSKHEHEYKVRIYDKLFVILLTITNTRTF